MSRKLEFPFVKPVRWLAEREDGWTLAWRLQRPRPPWYGLRLYWLEAPKHAGKTSFWLSWDGLRWRDDGYSRALRERYLALDHWARGILVARAGDLARWEADILELL